MIICTLIEWHDSSWAELSSFLCCQYKKRDHITPIVVALHWLPVTFRINLKALLFVYKSYIFELQHYYTPARVLRYVCYLFFTWIFPISNTFTSSPLYLRSKYCTFTQLNLFQSFSYKLLCRFDYYRKTYINHFYTFRPFENSRSTSSQCVAMRRIVSL